MKKGKETPPTIVKYIIDMKIQSPELTSPEIALLIKTKFGCEMDKSTVGRHLKENKSLIEQRIQEDKHNRQMAHIKGLQELARFAVGNLPDVFPDFSSMDDVTILVTGRNMVKVFKRLVRDFNWRDLKEHLGHGGEEMENALNYIDDVPDGSLRNPNLKKYEQDLLNTWQKVKFSGLTTIADSSDTRIWEWEGLNQRCENCPDKAFQPVETTVEDYDDRRTDARVLRKEYWKNQKTSK